jgi:hypothetical protein
VPNDLKKGRINTGSPYPFGWKYVKARCSTSEQLNNPKR